MGGFDGINDNRRAVLGKQQKWNKDDRHQARKKFHYVFIVCPREFLSSQLSGRGGLKSVLAKLRQIMNPGKK